MASGVEYSLYGFFFYEHKEEASSFLTFLKEVNNAPGHRFGVIEKLFVTDFEEGFQIPAREMKLIFQYQTGDPESKEKKEDKTEHSFFLRSYEKSALTAKEMFPTNTRQYFETKVDLSAEAFLKGIGMKEKAQCKKEGFFVSNSDNVTTYVYNLQTLYERPGFSPIKLDLDSSLPEKVKYYIVEVILRGNGDNLDLEAEALIKYAYKLFGYVKLMKADLM